MKRIYFVRHGQTEGNAKGVLVGRKHSPLTPLGREQAKAAGADMTGKPVDIIVSSPSQRALDTASIMAKAIGYAGEIMAEPLLMERDLGSAEGMLRDQGMGLINSGEATGFETRQQLYERTLKAVEALLSLPGEAMLVVAHNGNGKMLRLIAEGKSLDEFPNDERLANAKVYELTLE